MYLFEVLFWILLAILFYTYFGYGMVIYVLAKLKSRFGNKCFIRPFIPDKSLPSVTHLIAAYNEEDFIDYKIKNSLKQDYPKQKMQVLVVTDGSDDQTPELVKQYPEVIHMHEAARRGKIAAVKRAMKEVNTSIVVFSDANTYLNKEALRRIAAHFEDVRVGAVAGEKRIFVPEESTASVAGEGLYWKYESFLKKMDSEFNSVVGAAGELFAVRTDLMPDVPLDTIIEDFYLTMTIAMRGRKVAYEKEAFAMETGSASIEEEMKRKIRISAGAFQAMGRLKEVFNPFKYGWLTFQFISHRVLRWTLAPLALTLIFLCNGGLAISGNILYGGIFLGQMMFYSLALMGYQKRNQLHQSKVFFVPFYFTMMHLTAIKGFFRFIKGKQSVVWERAKRETQTKIAG